MMIIPEERAGRAEGRVLIDFAKDAFGRLEVELTGRGGEAVSFAMGEVLENDYLNRKPGGFRCYKETELRLKPGTHVYAFPIPTHVAPVPTLPKCELPPEAGGEIAPFRYAELIGYQGEFRARRFTCLAPFDDDAAEFRSSNPELDRVWEFCKYSIKATTPFGKYVDGERERLPYEGDAYINQLGHFCCDRSYKIARDTIEHFLLYPTWPTEWQLLVPVLARDYILYSGNVHYVPLWLPILKKRLLPELADADGLIRGNKEIRDIVDWPLGERDGYEFGDVNLVPNCYRYNALLAMADLTNDDHYRKQAMALRAAIRRTMLKNGVFVDNPASAHTSLHSAVFASLWGLAEKEEVPALAAVIREREMACSVYVAQFLLETCYRNGLADHALQLMTGGGLRSWQNMMEKGSTIAMEAWDDSFKPNQDWNHAWGAAPANVIPRELCGVRPLEPGFKSFTVEPVNQGLDYLKLRHPVPTGEILLELEGRRGRLVVPEGSRALCRGRELLPGEHAITL